MNEAKQVAPTWTCSWCGNVAYSSDDYDTHQKTVHPNWRDEGYNWEPFRCEKTDDRYHEWEPNTPLTEASKCDACGLMATDVMSGLEPASTKEICGEMVSMHERDSTNDKPCVLFNGHTGQCSPAAVDEPLFHDLYELSKNDHAIIVGSEIRCIIATARQLQTEVAELKAMARPAPATEPTGPLEHDFLYSRNKWHMLCNSLSLDAANTCVAEILDKIQERQG